MRRRFIGRFIDRTIGSIVSLMEVMTEWGEGVISVCNSSFPRIMDVHKKVPIFVIPKIVPIIDIDEPVRTVCDVRRGAEEYRV